MKKSISAMLIIVAIFSLITTGCSVGKNEITELKRISEYYFLQRVLNLRTESIYTQKRK